MTTKRQTSNVIKLVEYKSQLTESRATSVVKMVEYASSLSLAAWTEPFHLEDGDFISASMWNTYVVNNLSWFGGLHDHSGDPGDGADIPATIPQGAIAIFDTECPDGWTIVTAVNGYFLKGSSSYGSTGGEIYHSHPQSLYAYDTGYLDLSSDIGARAVRQSGDPNYYIDGEAMTVTGDSGPLKEYPYLTGSTTVEAELPSIQVIFCKKD